MEHSNEIDILSTIYSEVHPVGEGGYALIDKKLYGYANPSLDIVVEPVYQKGVYRNNYVILFEDFGHSVRKIIFFNKSGDSPRVHEFSGKAEGKNVITDAVETQALDYKLLVLKYMLMDNTKPVIGGSKDIGEIVFNALTGDVIKMSPGDKYISSSYRPFNNKVVYAIEEVGDGVEKGTKKKSDKSNKVTGITEDFECDTVKNILTKHYKKVEEKSGPFAKYKCTDADGQEVFVNKFGQLY